MAGSHKPGSLGLDSEVQDLNDGTMTRGMSPRPGPVSLEDFDLIGGLLEGFSKLNFSVPLCKTLIDHYCHGHGVELCLTEGGMFQCNALIDFGNDKRSPQFLRFVDQMAAQIARNAGSDPTRLKDHPLDGKLLPVVSGFL